MNFRYQAKAWLSFFACALAVTLTLPMAAAAEPTDLTGRRVLLLFSYHPTFFSSTPVREGLLSVLHPQGVGVTVEYMDSKRHNDPESR